jgi:hypothetical protein
MSGKIYNTGIPAAVTLFLFCVTTTGYCQGLKPVKESYMACGCGCCVGGTPLEKCLYHAKGDDLQKIKEEDHKINKSAQCAYVGCSTGILYHYCD